MTQLQLFADTTAVVHEFRVTGFGYKSILVAVCLGGDMHNWALARDKAIEEARKYLEPRPESIPFITQMRGRYHGRNATGVKVSFNPESIVWERVGDYL